MKTKLLIFVLVLGSLLVSSFLLFYQEGVVAKKSSPPLVSFQEYSKMSKLVDRKNALVKESAQNKSMLWRKHLKYYGAKLELDEKQRDFLRRLSGFIDEEFFANAYPDSSKERIKSEQEKQFDLFMKEAKNLFVKDQIKKLFGTVGDIATITDFGCNSAESKKSDSNIEQGAWPSCVCSIGSSCNMSCPAPTTHCGDAPCNAQQGCGCLGWYVCNGTCQNPPY